MKKIAAIFLLGLIVLLSPAYAQLGSQSFGNVNFNDSKVTKAEIQAAQTIFSNPGILPDNPLYLFKKIKENIQLLFTFSPEEKARLHLELAKTRLAEAKTLAEQNKPTTSVINDFNSEVEKFNNSVRGIGRNVSSIIRESEDVFKKSNIVLNFVLSSKTQEQSTGILHAIEMTSKSNISADTEPETDSETGQSVQEVHGKIDSAQTLHIVHVIKIG